MRRRKEEAPVRLPCLKGHPFGWGRWGRQLENSNVSVRIDAQRRGDVHSLTDDLGCREARILDEGLGGRLGKGAAGADSDDVVIRFDDLTVSGDDENLREVCETELGLEATEIAICSPFLGQLDRC